MQQLSSALRAVLEAFGFDTAHAGLERSFTTDLGLPKALVRISSHHQVFIGTLAHGWPSRADLEYTLLRLNAMGSRLSAYGRAIQLGPYYPTPDGKYIVQLGNYHYFITPVFDGVPAHVSTASTVLTHAIARFHQASADLSIGILRTRVSRAPTLRDFLTNSVLPQLCAAHEHGCEDLDGFLQPSIDAIAWIRDNRADSVDDLPALLIHGDFQPKNLLIHGKQGDETVRIIDAESSHVHARLFDLYFLLMGDDTGIWMNDLGGFHARIALYQRTVEPLRDTERFLLPNILQCKAAGVAAWAAEVYTAAPTDRRLLLTRYFQAALRCINYVHRHRDAIRQVHA